MGMVGVGKIGEIRRAYFEQDRSIKEIVRTLWRTIVVAAVIQGQVGLETSNNIIEKGLALRPRQSGSVVASTGY